MPASGNVVRIVEGHAPARSHEIETEIAEAAIRLARLVREQAELNAYSAIRRAFEAEA